MVRCVGPFLICLASCLCIGCGAETEVREAPTDEMMEEEMEREMQMEEAMDETMNNPELR